MSTSTIIITICLLYVTGALVMARLQENPADALKRLRLVADSQRPDDDMQAAS